jgi:hypothetical protein
LALHDAVETAQVVLALAETYSVAREYKISQNVVLVPERRIVVQEQDGNDRARIVKIDNVGWKRSHIVVFDYQRHQVVEGPTREGATRRYIDLDEYVEETGRREIRGGRSAGSGL